MRSLACSAWLFLCAASICLGSQTLTPLRAHFSVPDSYSNRQRIDAIRDSQVMSLFADGGFRTAMTLGEGTKNTAAAGSLGISVASWRSNSTVLLNVTGHQDTVRQTHASTLLYSTSGSNAIGGNVSLLLDHRLLIGEGRWGGHFYFGVAPMMWEASLTGAATQSVKATAYGFGAQLTLDLFDQTLNEGMHAAAFVDAGVAGRVLGSGIADSRNEALRSAILQTTRTRFGGFELGLTLQINNVRAAWSGYIFGGNIPGLSKGESIFAASIAGPLDSGRKKKRPK